MTIDPLKKTLSKIIKERMNIIGYGLIGLNLSVMINEEYYILDGISRV